MEKWMKRAVDLVAGLSMRQDENPAVVGYKPQKLSVSDKEKPYFPRSTPERHGLSSRTIREMLEEMQQNPAVHPHSVMVLRDGEVISECSHPGYDVHIRHLSHSMTKTVVGMAIGFLYDEGKLTLDQKLVDIFPEIPYKDKRFPEITVTDLLIMSSGVPFAESGTVSESRWTETFFGSTLSFRPGTEFSYNSMNSYILGKIVERISGEKLTEFLEPRLFRPLEIENVLWERGPEDLEKGGWGLYLSAESWAKLGQMMLDRGQWQGKTILSEEWVEKATKASIKVPEKAGPYNYGFQLWVARDTDNFLFNGMLGQDVWVCPSRRIVVALTSGNNELFQLSPALESIRKHLGGEGDYEEKPERGFRKQTPLRETEKHFFEDRHWIYAKKPKKTLSVRFGFGEAEPYDTAWDALLGKYVFSYNAECLLPLFVRVMQNNYNGGIKSVSFNRFGERLFMTVEERTHTFRMEVGLYDFKETVLEFGGEPYIVRVMGQAIEDEDRKTLFKVEILFPELPNIRMLKFSFPEPHKLMLRMSELPDSHIAEAYIATLPAVNRKLTFFVDRLEKQWGKGILAKKMREMFFPVLYAMAEDDEALPEFLAAQEKERKKKLESAKTVLKLIDKFCADLREE